MSQNLTYNITNRAQDIFHIHTAKCMCTDRYNMSEELHYYIYIYHRIFIDTTCKT